jgi:hypothetical protein
MGVRGALGSVVSVAGRPDSYVLVGGVVVVGGADNVGAGVE